MKHYFRKNSSILQETLEEIKKRSKHRSFDAYNLPVIQSVGLKRVLTMDNDKCVSLDQTNADLL